MHTVDTIIIVFTIVVIIIVFFIYSRPLAGDLRQLETDSVIGSRCESAVLAATVECLHAALIISRKSLYMYKLYPLWVFN